MQADSLEKDFIEGKISEKGLKEACIQRLFLGCIEMQKRANGTTTGMTAVSDKSEEHV